MSESPTFSIVIPVYNRSAMVASTLESVKGQSFADWECIVVDDGSMDGEALEDVVSGLHDARFVLVRRSNGGGGAARNSGVGRARGRYVAFLDSDDLFLPTKLEQVASMLVEDPKVAYYSRSLIDRGTGETVVRPTRAIGPNEDMGEYLFVHAQFLQTSTIVLDRRTALKVPFDPSLRKSQDLDLCIRLHAAGVRFRMHESPLSVWKDASEQDRTSRTKGAKQPLEWLNSAPLSRRAYLGYRATVLSYYLSKEAPSRAALDIAIGFLLAGVPAKVVARQVIWCFCPPGIYQAAMRAFSR